MDLRYEQLSELSFWRRLKASRAISKVVCAEAANEKMKQVSPKELRAREYSLLALDGNHVAGHVSVEGPIVGALFVDPNYRGKHIATRLVAAATKFVVEHGQKPVAYCNETSIKAFKNCDYVEAEPEPDKPNRTKMQYFVPESMHPQTEAAKILAVAAIAA
jgi:GNAT superfamily N-acetyltransferase